MFAEKNLMYSFEYSFQKFMWWLDDLFVELKVGVTGNASKYRHKGDYWGLISPDQNVLIDRA